MINKKSLHDRTTLFTCEFCGSGYCDIETAEDCEEHCSTREFASAETRRRATHGLKTRVIPMP